MAMMPPKGVRVFSVYCQRTVVQPGLFVNRRANCFGLTGFATVDQLPTLLNSSEERWQ
jgi:hypothetical protein